MGFREGITIDESEREEELERVEEAGRTKRRRDRTEHGKPTRGRGGQMACYDISVLYDDTEKGDASVKTVTISDKTFSQLIDYTRQGVIEAQRRVRELEQVLKGMNTDVADPSGAGRAYYRRQIELAKKDAKWKQSILDEFLVIEERENGSKPLK